MAHGARIAARRQAVQLAQLVWAIFGGVDSDSLNEYVQTGASPEPSINPAEEYDQEALQQAIKQANGQLGVLKD